MARRTRNIISMWTWISAFHTLPHDPASGGPPASSSRPRRGPRRRAALASKAARNRSETPCASLALLGRPAEAASGRYNWNEARLRTP